MNSYVDELYSINLSFANFAIIVRDGMVIDAAPIMRWVIGKPLQVAVDYVARRGGTIEKVERIGRQGE